MTKTSEPAKKTSSFVMMILFGLIFFGGLFVFIGHKYSWSFSFEEGQDFEFQTEIVTYTDTLEADPNAILELIPNFVKTPEGGVPWTAFGQTKEVEYDYKDEDDYEWTGVRPEFTEDLKKLDGTTILIQGHMFPLTQGEEQSYFLLGPFPMSCPYHYHVPPRLLIEVHTDNPIAFSFDAINIRGELELVPDDDVLNVFYRLNDAEIVPN